MRLARVVTTTHAQLAAPNNTPAAIPIRWHGGGRRRGVGVGIRVLGGRGGEGPAAEQLGAVLVVRGIVAPRFEPVELGAELRELGAEVAQALVSLVLLGRVEFLPGQGRVLVQRAREGRQRGRERA